MRVLAALVAASSLAAFAAPASADVPDGLRDGPPRHDRIAASDVEWLRHWATELLADEESFIRSLATVVPRCGSSAPAPDEAIAGVLREQQADAERGWERYEDGVDVLLDRAGELRRGEPRHAERSLLYRTAAALNGLGRRASSHRADIERTKDDVEVMIARGCSGGFSDPALGLGHGIDEDLATLESLVERGASRAGQDRRAGATG